MRKIILPLTIIFCIYIVSTDAHSQSKKWKDVSIIMEDGSIKDGKIKNFSPYDKKLKLLSGEVKTTLKRDDIKAVVIKFDEGYAYAEKLYAKGHMKGIFMSRVIEGKVSLYVYTTYSGTVGRMDHYYVKRKEEKLATPFTGLGFKSGAKKYFHDCEETIKYVENTSAWSMDLEKIINGYNSCKNH